MEYEMMTTLNYEQYTWIMNVLPEEGELIINLDEHWEMASCLEREGASIYPGTG